MRSLGLAVLVILQSGCGDPAPRELFETRVVPVLERRCLAPACHGVAPGAEAAGEVVDRAYFFVDVDATGRVNDRTAARANVKARINTVERAELSSLLRKPLALAQGGLPHAGGHLLGRDDRDWLTLREWVVMETDGGEGSPREALTPLERQFADTVLPVLRDRGCMLARCHGPQQFGGLPLTPPMDGAGGEPSVAEIRANREAARATLALAGDPARSRLLVKALPLADGGIPHRGGNDAFFPRVNGREPLEDPGAAAIVAWAAAERAALGHVGAPAPVGVVFVRGPASPRGLADLEAFRPGSDVWFHPSLLPGATPVNLSAGAHPDGPADVRDPTVSHDGSRVAFAMRRAGDLGHDLWEIGIDGGGLRRLTHDGAAGAGAGATSRWPVYGPGDAIHYVSTRAGHADESGRRADAELYRLAPDGTPVRLTFTPTPELAPSFLATGEFRGSLAFTTLRRQGGAVRGAVFRFPPDHDRTAHLQPEYHPHHGQTAPRPIVWTLRELPDGRDVAVLLGVDDLWEGGTLALVERQFGPDVPAERLDELAVGGFRHAWAVLADDGLWRDPAPLPDGRLLVAHAPGPIDPIDPGAMPDTGLWIVTLEATPEGARLGERTLLWDAPGEADDQPALVVARPDEDDDHADAWDGSPSGLLKHSGIQVNEAVNRVLAPIGAKPLRADAAHARFLAWPSWRPADVPAVDPAQIANGDPASTWWSNGVHLPLALLGEVPLAADGTVLAELPARVPVRMQVLDAAGFAAGQPSLLWLSVQGGERFPQGAQPSSYGRLCSGCHGALDGDPASALPPLDVDAVTTASVTLSSFAGRDPRRPLPPVRVGSLGAQDFDFGRDLAPSLARSCAVAGCHAGAVPAGGLALTPTPTSYYDAAYEQLQAFGAGSTGGKRYVDERNGSAWGSYLIEKITGRELGAPRVLAMACPPPGAEVPPLDDAVIRAFIRWIDLGAVYRAPSVEVPR